MKNVNSSKDLDTIVTQAVVELLMAPEFSSEWLNDLASEEGVELSDTQADYLNDAVSRVLDQLAIPFVNSLPEAMKAPYEESLRSRAAAYSDKE